jgi:hypothetical protein
MLTEVSTWMVDRLETLPLITNGASFHVFYERDIIASCSKYLAFHLNSQWYVSFGGAGILDIWPVCYPPYIALHYKGVWWYRINFGVMSLSAWCKLILMRKKAKKGSIDKFRKRVSRHFSSTECRQHCITHASDLLKSTYRLSCKFVKKIYIY